MPPSEVQRQNFKQNYGIDLTDAELQALNKEITKKTAGPAIFIIIPAVVLLFIVVGLVTDQLPMDVYTFVPLGVVFCMVASGADSLKKTTTRIEREFASKIKSQRGIGQPSAQLGSIPSGSTVYSPSTPSPTVQGAGSIKICGYCGQKNPFNSKFCNNCANQFPVQAIPSQQAPPVAEKIIMKEVVREIVKIRCSHCGTLVENTFSECPVCGARL
nr:zinc ribbon domain-containing protein [Candidatus Sigynarchaeota archaeon]